MMNPINKEILTQQDLSALQPYAKEYEQLNQLIAKLNTLVTDYNNSSKKSVTALQKIDAFSEQIVTYCRANPTLPNSKFMTWVLQDPVAKELSQLSSHSQSFNKQKIFMASSRTDSFIPSLSDWQKKTLPKKNVIIKTERSSQYQEIDTLLYKFHQATLRSNEQALKTGLILQKKVLHLLNNSIASNKPLMKKRFNTLLSQINNDLNQLIESDEKLKQTYAAIPQLRLINPSREQDKIKELVKHLAFQQKDHVAGDFHLHYLGGNNNKNWLAINEETGEHYVIRLEKADAPPSDYLLIDEVKKQTELNHYLAKDFIYHPVQAEGRDFNLAVSEYCLRGDILTYCGTKHDPAEVLNLVLDTTEKVAGMASAFHKENKAYFDIKPENFLIREDGSVITADIKSLQRITSNEIRVNDIIAITQSYIPPEGTRELKPGEESPKLQVEKLMAYQIGLLMYRLLVNSKGNDDDPLINQLVARDLNLNFDYPVFKTKKGQEAKQLIELAISADPDQRPSLERIVKSCQQLRKTDKEIIDSFNIPIEKRNNLEELAHSLSMHPRQ
ncbi:protein kinase domain-containing protein [Legionella fairfieldensis]|uniref:protein kinase domain-containing protein n=1 Tax=Legionella fairfieldensis TaxID=45064 RepID=UPI00048A89DD|nr:protein kinase family protein [Legionella fairfieldensis]